MNRPSECPHNLSARARRTELSRLEQQQLQAFLDLSPTLRIAHQVGLDFDRLSAVRSGDEQLVDRHIVAVARNHLQRHRRQGSFRRIGWLAAAAVVVTSASALGLHAGWKLVSHPDASAAAPAAAPAARPSAGTSARLGPRSPAPAHSVEPVRRSELPAPARRAAQSAPTELARDLPRRPSRALASFDSAEREAPTAAELFSRAHAAWHTGQALTAARLFERLQAKFPRSQEASDSHLSLGRLMLAQGRADSALNQFSAYRGPLLEEALLGRAEALAALGRQEEEFAIWQDMLRRFPGSVYARQARERLRNRADEAKAP